jgi:hypothetical protein
MAIQKCSFPLQSVLVQSGVKYHYTDSYQGAVMDADKQLQPVDLARAFFSAGPTWISALFGLRNKIVGVFGLKTPGKITDRQQMLDNFKCEPGERLGLFQVFDRTSDEVILGEDDKHLNFRISLLLRPDSTSGQQQIVISTTVLYNNWFGQLYFLPVRPFHSLIVPVMLKGMIRKLEAAPVV